MARNSNADLHEKLKSFFDNTPPADKFQTRMEKACALAGTHMRPHWRYPSQAPWIKRPAGKLSNVQSPKSKVQSRAQRDAVCGNPKSAPASAHLTLDDAIEILSGVIAARVAEAIAPRIERELALRITSAAAAQAPQVKRGPEKPAGKKPNDMSDPELIEAIHLAKKEERYADITPMIAVLRRREQGANAVAMALRDGAED